MLLLRLYGLYATAQDLRRRSSANPPRTRRLIVAGSGTTVSGSDIAKTAPEFAAGPESLEVALFDEDAIPWDELAFPVVNATLERFFADRRHGIFPVHNATLRPGDWGRGVRRS